MVTYSVDTGCSVVTLASITMGIVIEIEIEIELSLPSWNYSAIYLDLRNLNEQITLGVNYLLNKLHQTIEFAYEP